MKPHVASSLVGSGLIHKKNRVLCYHDSDGSALAWFSRRRFKVSSAASGARNETVPGHGVNRFHEVVLVHWEQKTPVAERSRAHMLGEAMAWVRPAGLLIVTCDGNGLFDDLTPEALASLLTDSLCRDASHPITPLACLDNTETFGFVVKKGGAYKPRCAVDLVDAPEAFARVCDGLMHEPRLGLDVETTLKTPRILCTVQLATASRVHVLDMLPMKDLQPLKRLMENEAVLKIIHNKTFEEEVLNHYGIRIHGVYDTLVASRKRSARSRNLGHKLSDVCERELGVYLDKSLQLSDWTCRPLTQEQLDYAAADAEVLIRLHDRFVPPKPPETMALF